MSNRHTEILMERALQGEISEEESSELQAALANDPEAREFLESARESLNLLLGHETAGLKSVDWQQLTRSMVMPKIGRWSLALGNFACAVGATMSHPGFEDLSLGITMCICILLFLLWARKNWRELGELETRAEEAFLSEAEFLPAQRAIVNDEHSFWRTNARRLLFWSFLLGFLALIADRQIATLATMAVAFFVVSFVLRFFVVNPLAAELQELEA